MDNATEYMFPPTETIESVKRDREHLRQQYVQVCAERDKLRAELESLKAQGECRS